MKKALTVLLVAAAALSAQASAGTGSTKQKAAGKTLAAKPLAAPKAVTTTAQPLTIPKDAVANSDGSYTWTDTKGTKWTYVRTPFGISRTQTVGATVAATTTPDVKVIDAGDKYRFELPTPFGINKWEKNKTDLNEQERGMVEAQLAAQKAKQE